MIPHLHGLSVLPLLTLLLAPGLAVAAEGAELEDIRGAIRESRERVGGHERQERQVLVLLEQSDRLLFALSREIDDARQTAEQAGEASLRLAGMRDTAETSLEATRRAMSRRVVALYKAGQVGPVRFLFASATLPELLNRVSALRTFVMYDADLVSRYRGQRDEFERLRGEARMASDASAVAVARLGARSKEHAVERRARRALLRRARDDRSQERALLVELEKAGRALEETLAALGHTERDASERLVGLGFAAREGLLMRPLPAEIKLPFGKVVEEIFGTETLRKGVELDVVGGETVVAVAPGVVRFAGWFRGYGKLVIVDQGDQYFTVMGHLENIFVAVGNPVAIGDTLGSAGDTGSLVGPSLYFEIRHGNEPLDPAAWFRSRAEVAGDRERHPPG